jgi:hypothetical protein
MLERKAAAGVAKEDETPEEHIRQAADAYRAALQVNKHPSAMLGLAMTCRMVSDDAKQSSNGTSAKRESLGYNIEYSGAVGRANVPITILSGILLAENGAGVHVSGSDRMVEEGRNQISRGLGALEELLPESSTSSGAQSNLDLETIRGIVDACSRVNSDTSPSDTAETSLAHQIIHEPQRGDLWLAVAKELAQQIQTDGSKQALDSTLTAARRAAKILMQRLVEPPPRCEIKFAVDADDVSDALALKFWLESVDVKQTDDVASCADVVDLQRSLLMCPGNALARDALSLPANTRVASKE